MFKAKRTIIMALAILVSLSLSIYGTLAYMTDSSTVVNTFTVGNVDITVDETEVTPDGQPTPDDNRVESNEYHLLPGHTYTKDPTMTVHAGSEESYLRMTVTLDKLEELKAIAALGGESFTLANIADGMDDSIWVPAGVVEDAEANTVTYEFHYYQTVDMTEAAEDLMLEPLFTSIVIPGEVTGDELATLSEMQITINGHAIQAYGFDNAEAAWTAFEAQVGTSSNSVSDLADGVELADDPADPAAGNEG